MNVLGGSTRIPQIQELIRGFFDGKQLSTNLNTDEAVISGATLQGALLSSQLNPCDIFLVDINPLAVGIETTGGVVQWMIKPMQTIPSKTSQIFSTDADNQTTITIKLFEGKQQMARDYHPLGIFDLANIPPAPRGVPQIEVTFLIDVHGILSISAKDKQAANENNIVIISNTKRLSQEEIDRNVIHFQ